MVLEINYASIEDVPDGYSDLYEEKDGKAVFSGIKGIRTQADVTRLENSLKSERDETAKWKEKANAWGDLDPDEVTAQLASIEDLQKAAESKGFNKEELDAMVAARVKSQTDVMERKHGKTEAALAEALQKIQDYEAAELRRNIAGDITEAAKAKSIGLRPEAIEDAVELGLRLMERTEAGETVTKDGVGVTPGLTAAEWLDELRERKPHWWPDPVGANARGSGAGGGSGGKGDCFSHAGWNVTAQARLVQEIGMEKANQIAAKYGTKVGGKKPPPPQSRG